MFTQNKEWTIICPLTHLCPKVNHMFKKRELLSILTDLGFAKKYQIYILPEMPPEVPKIENSVSEFRQRRTYHFHDNESTLQWKERKLKQWEQYRGKLVIIENNHTEVPTCIFAVDEFGSAKKVAISSRLLNDFNNELQNLKNRLNTKDNSLTISQFEFIKYISRYTGFHIEYGARFAKGLSTDAVMQTLCSCVTILHFDSKVASPVSISGRDSPSSPSIRQVSVFKKINDKQTGISNDDLYNSINLQYKANPS